MLKKFLSLTLLFVMVFALVACGETPANPTDSDQPASNSGSAISDTGSTEGSSDSAEAPDNSDAPAEPTVSAPNKMLACDQYNGRIVLYDLDMIEPGDDLDLAQIWELETGYCADMKYREDTVFGDVVITAGTTSGIYSYPEGEAIWTTGNPGQNPHAVEILPDGDIVIANSTGGTVRHFNVSAIKEDESAKVAWTDHTLAGAHGVVYDPENETLWALGSYELTGFIIKSDDTIQEVKGLGAMLPEGNQDGHDLSADYSDSRYLYLTSHTVLRFDKEECKFIKSFPQSAKLSDACTKGFGNNENNNFMFIVCNGKGNESKPWGGMSIADWCSDKIYFGYWQRDNFLKVQEYVSSTSAYYKTRPFVGTYQ